MTEIRFILSLLGTTKKPAGSGTIGGEAEEERGLSE